MIIVLYVYIYLEPGCDDGDGNIYYPGDYYFEYDQDKCNTYCYCNDNLESECQQGWDNILNNGDAMKYAFLSDCG